MTGGGGEGSLATRKLIRGASFEPYASIDLGGGDMRRVAIIAVTVLALAGCAVQVSSDPFTNASSQHRTQVEPDTFAYGSTLVSVFQTGRFFDGGASDIGWATSVDGGTHWSKGFLAGLTPYHGKGVFGRVSDPSVAYDARHKLWLVSSLAFNGPGGSGAVLVSSSTDGRAWSATPSSVAPGANLDKEWIVCDNHPASAFYGRCYVEYDDNGAGDVMHMARSSDGGKTWAEGTVPATSIGLGGQPLVQPAGKVVVPYLGLNNTIVSLTSTDGGATYSNPVTVAAISHHTVAGGLRSDALPSAEIDRAGKVYAVWTDCRFRANCAENDIVMSTSANGTTWSAVRCARVTRRSSSLMLGASDV